MNLSSYSLAAILAFGAVQPAAAQTARQAMFPSDAACYLRQYSRDHLASHQNQIVTQIALGPEYGKSNPDTLILRVAIYARGSDERYLGSAYCQNAGSRLDCGLAGYGGQFTLTPAANGAIKLQVGRDPLGFKGVRNYLTFGPGTSDDSTFLIPRVPADACP